MTHSFPTRRSSDLIVVNGDPQPDDARALDPGIVEHPAHRTAIEIADMARQREIDLFGNARERLPREIDEHQRDVVAIDVDADRVAGVALDDEQIGRASCRARVCPYV